MPVSTVARVALPLGVARTFSYTIPAPLASRCAPGSRVLVPFGRATRIGIVVTTGRETTEGLKAILEALDPHPLLDEALIDFTRWVADYYFGSWGQVLQAALPLEFRLRVQRRWSLLPHGREVLEHPFANPTAAQRRILELLARRGRLEERHLRRQMPSATPQRLEDLRGRGWIGVDEESRLSSPREQSEEWVRRIEAVATLPVRGASQRRILDHLRSHSGELRLRDLLAACGAGRSAIRSLQRKGLLIVESRILTGPVEQVPHPLVPPPTPTPAQEAAIAEIVPALGQGVFRTFFLEGVTGSGKTEVYLRAAQAARARGLSTLYLVPEIALTPLLAHKIAERFGSDLAVLHSGLSDSERWEALRRVRAGESRLVLGTRSAVFAPLPRLGLIVVDEEQDGSYYQSEAPRYHARDAALVRAKRLGAVALLGSATPSMEAVAATRKGKFHALKLPERVGSRPLPEVRLIDMREEFRTTGSASILSREMRDALAGLAGTGDQGILLLNRRGYATFLICRSCGKTLTCTSCSIAMTYHRTEDRLLCHYCSRSRRLPASCPECSSPHLHLGGMGTQRLEEAVLSLDPSLRVARMDRDAMRRAGHDQLLEAFHRRETDLLLGTQMLAKGHDFPGVTFVGVLSADAMLGLPDFRASERTYQLLTQVVGRAGRGDRPGRVLIQAFAVDHPALVAAARHDPGAFYEREMRLRRIAAYPPWVALTQVLVQSRDSLEGMRRARSLASALRKAAPAEVHILGPAPAPRLRLKEEYRYQILAKGKSRSQLASALREVLGEPAPWERGGIRVRVETDPRSLL